MKPAYNSIIISQIRLKLSSEENIGLALSEILGISTDAVYRRLRNEKEFRLEEVVTLCQHFKLSMDSLFELKADAVTFGYHPLNFDEFSVGSYLQNVKDLFHQLANSEESKLFLTINNTPFFQLFNFKSLLKLKLFFWAKSQLKADKYRNTKLADFEFSNEHQRLSDEILNAYNKIPSVELVDIELLQGFAREIEYHISSGEWISDHEANQIRKDLMDLLHHLKEQTALGRKFKFGTSPIEGESNFEVYYNETLNASSSFYYHSKEAEGIFLTHNFLNPLHSTDKKYVFESKAVLTNMLDVSTKISGTNQKMRNIFFENILHGFGFN